MYNLNYVHCVFLGIKKPDALSTTMSSIITIKTTCLSRPCKNGGVCIPVKSLSLTSSKTYNCKCSEEFQGRHCEFG